VGRQRKLAAYRLLINARVIQSNSFLHLLVQVHIGMTNVKLLLIASSLMVMKALPLMKEREQKEIAYTK
jgi:hypothetical protein